MKWAIAGGFALVTVLAATAAPAAAKGKAEDANDRARRAYVQDRLDTHRGFHCGSFFVWGKHRPVKAAKLSREAEPHASLAFFSPAGRTR
jgi:hypothetical protein